MEDTDYSCQVVDSTKKFWAFAALVELELTYEFSMFNYAIHLMDRIFHWPSDASITNVMVILESTELHGSVTSERTRRSTQFVEWMKWLSFSKGIILVLQLWNHFGIWLYLSLNSVDNVVWRASETQFCSASFVLGLKVLLEEEKLSGCERALDGLVCSLKVFVISERDLLCVHACTVLTFQRTPFSAERCAMSAS